jgi:hypothetical protein
MEQAEAFIPRLVIHELLEKAGLAILDMIKRIKRIKRIKKIKKITSRARESW